MTTTLSERSEIKKQPYSFNELFIDGHWRTGKSKDTRQVRNPYDDSLLAEIPLASVADIEDAFESARRAQPSWEATLPAEKARILRNAAEVVEQRKEEFISWLIRESGSTRIKATWEVAAVQAILIEASTLPTRVHGRILNGDIPGKEHRIYRKGVGVVAVISPWNWPGHLSSRSIAPALALGNTVVLKPATDTAISGGLIFGKIFEEAGLPSGVLSVVVGSNTEIGDPFVLNPISRVLSFTGSTRVGRRVGELAANGPTLKKTMLELGGNNPIVVLEDADLDLAVRASIAGKFFHQGQICVAANRIIVHDKVYDEFEEAYVAHARKLKFGDPNDPETHIGPIISKRQMAALQKMLDTAKQEGSKKLLGQDAEGLVLPPQIFGEITSQMSLGKEEIFGPIAPLIRASSAEEAIRIANDTEFGLSSAIFTRDVEHGMLFAHQIEAGMTHINDMPAVDLPNTPFGGEKNSGLGRYGAHGVIEDLTTEHWISVQHTPRSFPF